MRRGLNTLRNKPGVARVIISRLQPQRTEIATIISRPLQRNLQGGLQPKSTMVGAEEKDGLGTAGTHSASTSSLQPALNRGKWLEIEDLPSFDT